MPVSIRIEDDLVAYFEDHGKFGETHSDVLRRLLPAFSPRNSANKVSLTKSPEASPKKSQSSKASRNSYPKIFGYALSNVVRSLGSLGWSEDQAEKALIGMGVPSPINPAMLKTQIHWGKQWGKKNPHCRNVKNPYGTKPPELSAAQLSELKSHLA